MIDEHREKLYSQVQDQFGRVTYTYTCQLKQADRLGRYETNFKTVQLVLSLISTIGVIDSVVSICCYTGLVSGISTVILLVVNAYMKNNNFSEERRQCYEAGQRLWLIRERYISLMTDFVNLTTADVIKTRDELVHELDKVYSTMPKTDPKAYKEAQKALKENQEQFFSQEELNKMLPENLRR